MRFKDKCAIVTGAARGIGRAAALLFAQEGAQLVACDMNEEGLKALEEALGQSAATHLFRACDVSDEEAARALVRDAISQFGKVDILINNAGIYRDQLKPFVEQSSALWRRKMEVNVLGMMYLTQEVLPGMMNRRYGKIVNVASVAGVYGLRNMVDYSATKGAQISFSMALAREMGPYGIHVNAVSPGNINTYAESPGLSYFGRSGTAEECANVIAFLASDDASYVSGQNYIVDGCRKTL